MNRSYNHMTDNFGLPLPKLVIVHGCHGEPHACVVELLEQGLRGAASAYRVFTVGGDEIQTPDTSEILSALRNSAYQLVIVNVTSGMAAVKITEDAANAGFTYGIVVSRYRRLHGYAHLFNNGCAEFVRLFPAIPEVLRKQL